MKTQSFDIYLAQLLLMEGVRVPEPIHYTALREVFDSCREQGFREEAITVHTHLLTDQSREAMASSSEAAEEGSLSAVCGLEPSLFGLSLTAARRLWRDYYGIRGVEKMGGDCLRRMSFDDWRLALLRQCWLPLCCEKMPFQQLSNVVADCIRFYDDAPVVLSQLLDILEHLRQFFARPFDPLPPSTVITNNITRRLNCQISSKPLCAEVVQILTDKRLQFVNQRAETDAEWARHSAEMIGQAEKIMQLNTDL